MKKLFSMILCCALVLSLAACGNTTPTEPPITATDVFTKVQQAMHNNEATRLRMELGFSMRITYGEGDAAGTTELSYGMMTDTIVSTEPFGTYTLLSYSHGLSEHTNEAFVVEEEGSVVSYLKLSGAWTRTDFGMGVSEFINSNRMTEISTNSVWTSGQTPTDLTLEESTRDLDGTEVYILHCNISIPNMSETFASLGVGIGEEANALSYPATYYVDAQNFTILRLEVDLQVMMDLLTEVMEKSTLEDTIEIQITNAIYDLGYGPQEIPAVPQEAYDYRDVIDEEYAGSGNPDDFFDKYTVVKPPVSSDERITVFVDGVDSFWNVLNSTVIHTTEGVPVIRHKDKLYILEGDTVARQVATIWEAGDEAVEYHLLDGDYVFTLNMELVDITVKYGYINSTYSAGLRYYDLKNVSSVRLEVSHFATKEVRCFVIGPEGETEIFPVEQP